MNTQDSNPNLDAALSYLSGINQARIYLLIIYSLLVYDWLLCLEAEYTLIHRSPMTKVKACYLFCRYYPLLVYPAILWVILPSHALETCRRIILPACAAFIPLSAVPQGVLLLRAYAFTGKTKTILYTLCPIYVAFLALDIWVYGTNIGVASIAWSWFGRMGCVRGNFGKPGTHTRLGLAALGNLCMDLISATLVITHCFRIRSTRGHLGGTFLKQGLAVFAIMSTLNLFTACIYLGPQIFRTRWSASLPFVLGSLNMLACRLILSLRGIVARRTSPTESQALHDHSLIVGEAIMQMGSDEEMGLDGTTHIPIDHEIF